MEIGPLQVRSVGEGATGLEWALNPLTDVLEEDRTQAGRHRGNGYVGQRHRLGRCSHKPRRARTTRGRGEEGGLFWSLVREGSLAHTLIWDIWPPKLRDSGFLLL